MNRAYLTGLPRNLMRQLAGFPKEMGHFYLPRATLDPPEELQRMVFPWVEEWLDRISSGTTQRTTTVVGFLKLLQSLRTIFLQDSVQMRKRFPDHFVWHHVVFEHPLYKKFSEDLSINVQDQEANDPFNMKLRASVPFIEQKMTTIESQMTSNMVQTNSKLNEVLQHISDISTGRAPLNINIDIPRNQFATPVVTTNAAVSDVASSNVAVSSRASQGSAPDVGSSQPQRSSTALYTYTLSRGVRDLKTLWREWHTGLAGGPSVVLLEKENPTCKQKDRSFYYRRLRIINRIKTYAEKKGVSYETALQLASNRQDNHNTTLDAMSKNLNLIFGE